MNDTIEIHEEKDSGFTLIELLIVIVILGILATVTVFAVSGITDNSKTSACNADMKTIQTALEAYYVEATEYPDTLGELEASGLARGISTKFVYTPIDEVVGTSPANYRLEGIDPGDCAGIDYNPAAG